ncbi:hypothetical protein AKJ40_02165 [candidate division MSBL1 archaeon SCGC-AAA259M10]|uniref:siroheme decarboxylase n=1 Tax=candidate division MSBL1 archaeon SCGC-AAA259M10 TaxID=1698270 RepID=A0A133V0H4_9EURY|nr:hypothetical protein AKJ40_02165 [candidate division MSBL1 archaeon SCGC-AAA259M10]
MNEVDIKILRRIQSNFPIQEKPFESLSKELGIDRGKLIRKIQQYESNGYIRKISPKLASSEIGYKASTLVAMKVPEGRTERVAKIVNEYNGVSLNFERECGYNLWFTLHAKSEEELLETIDEIKERTDPIDLLNLPKRKKFKLDVEFEPLKEDKN